MVLAIVNTCLHSSVKDLSDDRVVYSGG